MAVISSGTTFPELRAQGITAILAILAALNSDGPAEETGAAYRRLVDTWDQFIGGGSADLDTVLQQIDSAAMSLAVAAQGAAEVAALVRANPGTLAPDQTREGHPLRRSWR